MRSHVLAFALALASAPLAGCLDAPPEAAVDGGAELATTVEPIGSTLKCSQLCTSSSSCTAPCIDDVTGYGTSCGKHGVCVSCSAGCSSGSTCDLECMQGTTLSDCHHAGAVCNSCSAATCDAQGCGAYCLSTPVIATLTGFPTLNQYDRCDAITTPLGDADSDAMPDSLEDALARRFLPNIYLSGSYGNNDQQSYAIGCAGDPLCRMPYVVRKVGPLRGARTGWCAQGQCAEIIYGLPYNWDLGKWGIGEHRGDSEHIAVLVAYRRADDEPDGHDWGTTWSVAQGDASVWRQVAFFWGAHTCDHTDGIDWDSSRFVWPYINGTYSQVGLKNDYVSTNKHANYQSLGECEDGADLMDSCPTPHLVRSSVLARLFNAGDRYVGTYGQYNFACLGFPHTLAYPGASSDDPPLESPAYDLWGTASFGAAHSQPFSLWMSRGAIDWGNESYACPP
jgi:hypothetical protein